ncbi:MAG: 4Fe-4S binding protein [Actinobacteria bacterium]|nr:4Fe-4S binding protein [Actinomycetota bacterium]
MVNVATGDDVYVRLREFLDRLPSGFPATESGVELRLLRKLFTPEEAELAMRLRLFPEPARVIARRCGLGESEAAEKLEDMARKGLVLRVFGGRERFYLALHFVVGIYEFHLNDIDRELAEMFEEYIEHAGRTLPKQYRVVPVGAAVPSASRVAPYDRVRELVSRYEDIAVAPCICRREKGLLGEECDKPSETCLTFGVGAQLYVENGLGRRIDAAEALAVLDRAEEAGLVLNATNARDIVNICCCCSCCCGVLRALKLEERPAEGIRSPYYAEIDPASCDLCGTCLERCQMEALRESDGSMRVDRDRCIGCGLCVSTCPAGAVRLVTKEDVPAPYANYFHNLAGVAGGRGLPFGKMTPVMRLTKIPVFLRVLPYLYKTGLVTPVVNLLARRGWV